MKKTQGKKIVKAAREMTCMYDGRLGEAGLLVFCTTDGQRMFGREKKKNKKKKKKKEGRRGRIRVL